MENETDRLQHFALSIIFCFYTVCMAVNAVQAIMGRAELARHHFIPFGLVTYAWLASVPQESYRKLRDVIRAIVMAVAKGMLAFLKTLRALPGIVVRTLAANYQEA